jgi:hypothetical protein
MENLDIMLAVDGARIRIAELQAQETLNVIYRWDEETRDWVEATF